MMLTLPIVGAELYRDMIWRDARTWKGAALLVPRIWWRWQKRYIASTAVTLSIVGSLCALNAVVRGEIRVATAIFSQAPLRGATLLAVQDCRRERPVAGYSLRHEDPALWWRPVDIMERTATMNAKELAKNLADKHGVSEKQARELLNALLDGIVGAAIAGEEVSLPGFGKFKVKAAPERSGRNPSTGEAITIAASRKLAFTPAKALKDRL